MAVFALAALILWVSGRDSGSEERRPGQHPPARKGECSVATQPCDTQREQRDTDVGPRKAGGRKVRQEERVPRSLDHDVSGDDDEEEREADQSVPGDFPTHAQGLLDSA